MKPITVILAVVVVALVVGFGFYMVDIDQTEEARLPDVDVSVEGGNLPKFDADVGSVNIGQDEVTVTVPTLEVTPPEENTANN